MTTGRLPRAPVCRYDDQFRVPFDRGTPNRVRASVPLWIGATALGDQYTFPASPRNTLAEVSIDGISIRSGPCCPWKVEANSRTQSQCHLKAPRLRCTAHLLSGRGIGGRATQTPSSTPSWLGHRSKPALNLPLQTNPVSDDQRHPKRPNQNLNNRNKLLMCQQEAGRQSERSNDLSQDSQATPVLGINNALNTRHKHVMCQKVPPTTTITLVVDSGLKVVSESTVPLVASGPTTQPSLFQVPIKIRSMDHQQPNPPGFHDIDDGYCCSLRQWPKAPLRGRLSVELG